MKTKLFLPLIIIAMLLLGACTHQSCPTYSDANYIPSKWDTVPATYADVEAYMRADTTPHRFTVFEKTGALLGLILIGSAIKNDQ